jgi:hypothetical protein
MNSRADLVRAQTRPVTHKGAGRQLPRPDPNPFRTIGLGSKPDQNRIRAAGVGNVREGFGDLVSSIIACKACPIYNMPIIEQVRWTLGGPLLDTTVQSAFGSDIDLFGSGKNVPGIEFVETTMAQPGQLQVPTLCCAIAFHLESEPFEFTVQGNGWTRPAVAAQQPMSPDVFTENDVLHSFSAAIGNSSQLITPASLMWGYPTAYAFWHMARGYDLRWKIGQHTNIMDEMLRHTAYTPPNAQSGSTAGLNVEVSDFVRQINDRYDALGSALTFLKITHTRIGSTTSGGVNVGLFRPTRAFTVVPTTVGGVNLRDLLGANSEFRKLTVPYLISAGIPIGLIAQESDTVEADQMRRWLSITQGFGAGIPPIETDDINILATSTSAPAGTVFAAELELNEAIPATLRPQGVDNGTALFKGGEGKITLAIKGFEVDGDWASVLSSNPDLRDAVMRECGCGFAGRN